MSEDTQQEKSLTTRPKAEVRVVTDDSAQAYLFDTARFEHLWRVAGAFAASNLIPKHLREDKSGAFEFDTVRANAFLIINQAIRWGFDPVGLFRESYVVGGVLGYQGKLVTAVINARAGLKTNLDFKFNDKKGPELEVTVIGTLRGEDTARTITLTVAQAKTANDIWVKDPEQKLCYSGAIKWARRHAPEVVLGVLIDDDVEKIALGQAKPVRATIVERPVFKDHNVSIVDEDKKVPLQHHERLVTKSQAEIEDDKILKEYVDTLSDSERLAKKKELDDLGWGEEAK